MKERCDFNCSYFLPWAHAGTSSEQHEVRMWFQVRLLSSASIVWLIRNFAAGSWWLFNINLGHACACPIPYHPSPWVENHGFRVQERVVVYLPCVYINSPAFWNNIPWRNHTQTLCIRTSLRFYINMLPTNRVEAWNPHHSFLRHG